MFSVQCSVFIVQCSMFIVQCSVFIVQCSMFGVRCSVFGVQCSVFSVRCSVFNVRCSVFSVQSSALSLQLIKNTTDKLYSIASSLHYVTLPMTSIFNRLIVRNSTDPPHKIQLCHFDWKNWSEAEILKGEIYHSLLYHFVGRTKVFLLGMTMAARVS